MTPVARYHLRHRRQCGAKTRAGSPCRRAPTLAPDGWPSNGRCTLHGGQATGPRTVEGKAKSSANLESARQVSNAPTPEGQALRAARNRKSAAGRWPWRLLLEVLG